MTVHTLQQATAMSDEPKYIQRKRSAGWEMPENTVYVGRPTRWGNPFRVVQFRDEVLMKWRVVTDDSQFDPVFLTRKEAAEFAVDLYRDYMSIALQMFAAPIHELAGKSLSCWCNPDEPCHAKVLLELANN